VCPGRDGLAVVSVLATISYLYLSASLCREVPYGFKLSGSGAENPSMRASLRKHGQSLLLGIFSLVLLVAGLVNNDKSALSTTLVVLATGCFVLGVLLSRAEGALKLGPGGLEIENLAKVVEKAAEKGFTPQQTGMAVQRYLKEVSRIPDPFAGPRAILSKIEKGRFDRAIREAIKRTQEDLERAQEDSGPKEEDDHED
jgi:hypothetical protein